MESEEEKVLPFYASSLGWEEQKTVDKVALEKPTEPLAEVRAGVYVCGHHRQRMLVWFIVWISLLEWVLYCASRALLEDKWNFLLFSCKRNRDGIKMAEICPTFTSDFFYRMHFVCPLFRHPHTLTLLYTDRPLIFWGQYHLLWLAVIVQGPSFTLPAWYF